MRPKYSLGQNFLKNPGIIDKIVRFAEVESGDTVLEVGPGTGMLTVRLLEYASRVIAVEKDDALFEQLKDKFGDNPRFALVLGDILDSDLNELIGRGTKVVANLPYNIASHVVLMLADAVELLSSATVMVQKEVALRICASVGQKDYSALSIIVGSVFDPIPGFIVGPNNFYPQPKVDSMVIKLLPKVKPLRKADREGFRRVVFGVFGQRRKMLRNSLLNLPGISREMLPEISQDAGISLQKRPQDLSWEDFYRLSGTYRRLTGC